MKKKQKTGWSGERRVFALLLVVLLVLGVSWLAVFFWGGISAPPNISLGVPTVIFGLCLVLAVLVVYGEEEEQR